MIKLLLCTFIIVQLSQSVERSNFKTCDESSFCKRHRNVEANKPFNVISDSIKVAKSSLSMNLVKTDETESLINLSLFTLESNVLRVRFTEINPLVSRYEPPVGDALVSEPVPTTISDIEKSGTSSKFNFGDNTIEIFYSPLRVDIYEKDSKVPLMSLNSKALLKFEHTRKKSDNSEEINKEAEAANVEDENKDAEEHKEEEVEPKATQEEGLWEESFKSHQDTKPKGPQSIGLDFVFPGFEHAFGIPEHADTFKLKSTISTDPYRLYNLDVFEYELYNPMALYGSIPFMVMHNTERTMGLLWMNAAETWVDIRSTNADKSTFRNIVDYVKGDNEVAQLETHWFSETGVIDVFILLGEKHNPKAVFSAYKSLTGSMPLPPLFALSYHQCRWNYNDEADVIDVDSNYDKYDIPMDVLWLDIEHTDGKKYFTWDAVKFPDSVAMINTLAAKGRKMVTIIDPHIKRDDSYFVHKAATDAKYYIKDRNSNDYDGWCWPGSSSWLDFTSPDVRKFWANTFQPDTYVGSTLDLFTWNDMNEPSVFNGPEITMHKDAIHYNEIEHRDLHNIYGMYQQRASGEAQIQRSGKRPFVLSRAFFVGTQRYGAIWTGDNKADWEHLKISIPMLLSLNIAGIVLAGADVGGFFGNPEPELMMRWYQAGAFQPFFRAHAHIDTKRREPWLVAEPIRLVIRNAIRRRYALLPFWYTLFHESEQTGMPVMRPLWMEFPSEKQYFDIEDQYFLGSSLMIHPVTTLGATSVEVTFPGENEIYYDVDTMEATEGNTKQFISLARPSKIPVYHRGGHIISRKQRVRRSSILMKNDPYTITIALDINGKASGKLYIDDYEGFDYQKGDYVLRKFECNKSQFTSSNLNPGSSFTSKSWVEKIIIAGIDKKPTKITLLYSDKKQQLEAAYDDSKNLLIIRKPAVNIAIDFKINISY